MRSCARRVDRLAHSFQTWAVSAEWQEAALEKAPVDMALRPHHPL